VSESVVRTVHIEDGVRAPLELLPVLAPERMAELLARELEAIGFVREGTLASRVEHDGLEITVDLAAASVTVRLGADTAVAAEARRSGQAYDGGQGETEQRLRAEARDEIESKLAAKTETMRRAISTRLEGKLADLRAELDAAVGRATVAALTERATQLGQVEEVVADDAGNVTIRVKL
jgi:hypothetical protein